MHINVNSCPHPASNKFTGLCRALLVALLLQGTFCLAGDRAYGEDFFRAGSSWHDALPLRLDKPLTPSATSVSEFQRQLDEMQQLGGPYSDALAEPLTGLARSHLASGDVEEAGRLYRRALHIVRVNDGLYSERQIPILQELLALYRSTGDLESLDRRYDYYFRLYGSGQPPFTEVRLRAALGYLRWQREALRLGMDGERHQRLLNLYRLNDELIKATAESPDVSAAQYREVVLSQLRNLYLLEDRVQPRLEKIGVVETAPAFGGEWEQSDFERKRLETLQRGALSLGARLLGDAIERSAGTTTPEELARLYLELGDWYQWHGSSNAGEYYTRVVEILSKSGRHALLEGWLGQPVELPDNGAFWQPSQPVSGQRRILVETRYDVSASGRIRNLTGTAVSSEDESKAERLKRELRKTRFRPRWVNGEAEAVTGVERRYEWVD
jgi:tetratricopeptide (TPR) repeat protein